MSSLSSQHDYLIPLSASLSRRYAHKPLKPQFELFICQHGVLAFGIECDLAHENRYLYKVDVTLVCSIFVFSSQYGHETCYDDMHACDQSASVFPLTD